MNGRLRMQYAGALYQVISRRNARHGIFGDGLDRKRFLNFLGTVTEDFCWLREPIVLCPTTIASPLKPVRPTCPAGDS